MAGPPKSHPKRQDGIDWQKAMIGKELHALDQKQKTELNNLVQKQKVERQAFWAKHGFSSTGNNGIIPVTQTPLTQVQTPVHSLLSPALKSESTASAACGQLKKDADGDVEIIDLTGDDETKPRQVLEPRKPASLAPITHKGTFPNGPHATPTFTSNVAKGREQDGYHAFTNGNITPSLSFSKEHTYENHYEHQIEHFPSARSPQNHALTSSPMVGTAESRFLPSSAVERAVPSTAFKRSDGLNNHEPTHSRSSTIQSGTFSRKKNLQPDKNPEISVAQFRTQQNDRSSILSSPPTISRDPSLHALETHQKAGHFVSNILHNRRSHDLHPDIESVLRTPDRKSAQETEEERQSLLCTFKFRANPCDKLKANKADAQTDSPPQKPQKSHEQSILDWANRPAPMSPFVTTPPSTPRHEPMTPKTPRSTKPELEFKIPTVPTTPRSRSIRHGSSNYGRRREGSTSSQLSNTSFFSSVSHQTSATQANLKRRAPSIDLSDQGSDYEPSPPSSPELSKASLPNPTATTPQKLKQDNPYGSIRPVSAAPHTPPTKSNSKSKTPSTPAAPKAKRFKSSAQSSSSPSVRAASRQPAQHYQTKLPAHFVSTKAALLATRTKRRAGQAALNKIKGIAKEKFAEKPAWERDEEVEMNDVGGRMRSMSLTPAQSEIEAQKEWKEAREMGEVEYAKKFLGA